MPSEYHEHLYRVPILTPVGTRGTWDKFTEVKPSEPCGKCGGAVDGDGVCIACTRSSPRNDALLRLQRLTRVGKKAPPKFQPKIKANKEKGDSVLRGKTAKPNKPSDPLKGMTKKEQRQLILAASKKPEGRAWLAQIGLELPAAPAAT